MTDEAKLLGSTFRDDKLISGVARHLLKEEESDRRSDCIHPSEASHDGWCPRATYYRIMGVKALPVPRKLAFEMVFETGHEAHTKWQNWFWEMGLLQGRFRCLSCGHFWGDISPKECPICKVGGVLLKYAEVPVESPEYLLAGQADGDILREGGSVLIEVKTIGTGTVRIEAPSLMKKYTYEHIDEDGKVRTGVDWYGLWSGIRRPFPSHLRQGMIYCFCAGRKEMIYIYDPKFVTAYPKEFEIQFHRDFIEDILDQCIRIKNSLEKQRPPKRPMWAERTHTSCKVCPYRNECWHDRELDRPDSGTKRTGEVRFSQTRSLPTRKTRELQFTETPFEAD